VACCKETTILLNFLLSENGHAHYFLGVRVQMESCVHVASCRKTKNAVYFMFRITCLLLMCCVCLFHIEECLQIICASSLQFGKLGCHFMQIKWLVLKKRLIPNESLCDEHGQRVVGFGSI
jgi:hypothetical protein